MSRARRHMPTAIAIAVALAAVSQSACGDDSSSDRPVAGSPENPLVAEHPEESAPGSTREPAAAPSRSADDQGSTKRSGESAAQSGAGEPNYQALVDDQVSHPQSRFTPCNLVTAGEARAIVGAPMREPIEAPQGPTCIYRTRTGDDMVALAVQTTDFGKIKPRLRRVREVAVSNRSGYCGTYGQSMLYVPLSGGRMLSVSAPCEVARDFAAKALPQL